MTVTPRPASYLTVAAPYPTPQRASAAVQGVHRCRQGSPVNTDFPGEWGLLFRGPLSFASSDCGFKYLVDPRAPASSQPATISSPGPAHVLMLRKDVVHCETRVPCRAGTCAHALTATGFLPTLEGVTDIGSCSFLLSPSSPLLFKIRLCSGIPGIPSLF